MNYKRFVLLSLCAPILALSFWILEWKIFLGVFLLLWASKFSDHIYKEW